MIHIDRKSVPRPAIFASAPVRRANREAKEFFAEPITKRAQKRYAFDAGIFKSKEIGEALAGLFHGKCAFCESDILATGPIEIDLYRPKANCLGLDGTHYPDLYWWLAYEWTNFYTICQSCNMRKGTRFPVEDEARRATGPGDSLDDEKPLLLDPCSDAPEQHLVFQEDGSVSSATERGRITIEVFGLNRNDLVKDRRAEYDRLQHELTLLKTLLHQGESIPTRLRLAELTRPGRAFAGLRNQFIVQWLHALPPHLRESLEEPDSKEAFSRLVEQPVMTKSRRKEIDTGFKAFQTSINSYSVAKPEKSKRYFVHTRLLRRIEIHNFKIIRDLKIELSTGQADRAAWLMLLGENGTGKSSILLAVALALAGQRYLHSLRIKPTDVLRRGAMSGFVKVYLTGSHDPIELHFSKRSNKFITNPPEPKVYLLGYGATRLLPRPGTKPLPGTSHAHIDNLLNPFVPLKDASQWLLALYRNDKARFQFAARAIKDILALDEEAEIDIRPAAKPRVEARVLGTWVPIEQLSDGYQSVLALVTDIMAVLQDSYDNMEIAEGIVLLDEIGAHLHPRWMMRIVSRLRKTFPRVQFLASTHDPLCLKGVFDGEVAVMSRLEGNAIAMLTDLPSVQGMRVDQILTSEHFGLDSAIDPELDGLFQEYYHLLALRQRSTRQETRLVELRQELDQYRVLGSTRRERILLEAADQYLAKDRVLGDGEEKLELKEETRRKVAEMWEQVKLSEVSP